MTFQFQAYGLLQVWIQGGHRDGGRGSRDQRSARIVDAHVLHGDERLKRRVAAGEDIVDQGHTGHELASAGADHRLRAELISDADTRLNWIVQFDVRLG